MRKLFNSEGLLFSGLFLLLLVSCNRSNKSPSNEAINEIKLKRGEVVLCGPPDKQFGSVAFEISCSGKVKNNFNLAVSLLHSFEYDEAEKVFAKIIDEEPGCAMAYWGVAMANYHPLWAPPNEAELEKGAKAISIAQSLTQKTKRESDYIEAIGLFYKNWKNTNHLNRSIRFEKAMGKIYAEYPNDMEAAILYALSLDAAADPTDTSFANQRKAGDILTALYSKTPNHPGIVHYIIHSYDYPSLANLALPSAKKYASIAPGSAHAQHMPSHIFTRLGFWDECINSNIAAVAAAKCYAENAGLEGHWDEELHCLDYLTYAYLQKGDNNSAKEQWDYLKTIHLVEPTNFKVAYAFAAIPARYLLENKLWKEAASLRIHPLNLGWKKFPWQKSIIHFTRLLGSVHAGDLDSARVELKELYTIYNSLMNQKDSYKANQVLTRIKTSEAWILFKLAQQDEPAGREKNKEALILMNIAADMEDKTEKHPVSPGEIIPARELLGDMLLQMNQPEKALEAFEADLKKNPNRFNGLYGAGLAAEKANNLIKANYYYQQLIKSANSTDADRTELEKVKLFMKKQKL